MDVLSQIHPELWRGHQLGRLPQRAVPTGWVSLDGQLPGGGWPRQALTELLLKHPGVGEMRLLASALSAIARGYHGTARAVMLFDPPATPCAWAMEQLGLPAQTLIVVHGREGPRGAALRHLLTATDVLWALEQALRSGHAGAILAWLPDRLRADSLRRLQLAAQAHDGPVFLLRGIEERVKPSPAPLRLALHPEGPDGLTALILKRRGPPLQQPLSLSLLPLAAVDRRQRVPHVAPVSEEDAGPPQVFLTPSGGLTGKARQVWGRSEEDAGPPQVFLRPHGGPGRACSALGGSVSLGPPVAADASMTAAGLSEAVV